MPSHTIHPQGTILQERYRIIEAVGTGGYGVVYKAEDTQRANSLVAVKSINLAGLSTQEVIEATEAFNREVLMLSRLKHFSLPGIHDHFTDPEHWYMVMDFIEGETLENYIMHADMPQNGTRCLPLIEVLDIGMRLCTVLGYLHMQEPSIIFRDLKPANIMRTSDRHLYLIDFGIARHFKYGQAKDTIPLGSPGYAAPEQYGRTQTTPRADIYSLGAVLHQLISGDDPSETPFHFAHLLSVDSPVLATLDELLLQMVERDERNRPASITVVKRQLQQMRFEVLPAPDVAPPVKTRKKNVSRRVFVGTLATVLVAGALVRTVSPAIINQVIGSPHAEHDPALYTYRNHRGNVSAVAWSPEGDMIASGDSNGNVYVWKPSGETVLSWPPRPVSATQQNGILSATGILALSWSASGQQLAIADGNGNIDIWDFRQNATLLTYNNNMVLNSMAWSPDGKYIAVGSNAYDVQVWEAGTTRLVADLQGKGNYVLALAWSPDSRHIVTGNAFGAFFIWDVATGEQLYIYDAASEMEDINIVAWSPDGKFIVVNGDVPNSYGNDLLIFSSATVVSGPHLYYGGHNDIVTTAKWSPDSKLIASASIDATVQVWETAKGQTKKTYTGHTSGVNAVSWSPNGQLIASGGDDGTVQVWKP